MGGILELADRLWRDEASGEDANPLLPRGDHEEVAPGVLFIRTLGNVIAFATGDELVLVDSGSTYVAEAVHATVRGWSDRPVHTCIYSHGHADHVFGIQRFDAEAAERGWGRPRVVAHEAVPARFERYRLTAGYNAWINMRQFNVPVRLEWPTEYREPDLTYHDAFEAEVGGERFELRHARGETDDHTWTWVPGRKVLCTGDLFIWSTPNAGNPQKVQRYPREWAAALREMAGLGAELLLPGHGVPIAGTDRIGRALTDTAALLEAIVEATLALMNDGAPLDLILHEVRPPADLADRPYLRPIYDDPEFIVRNVWRGYGGWYDGNPATLKPAPEGALAAEVAALAGGADRLAARARELADAGDLRLAGHLAGWAALAAPEEAAIQRALAEVLERRVEAEPSLMAKGIFGFAAREARGRAGDAPGP